MRRTLGATSDTSRALSHSDVGGNGGVPLESVTWQQHFPRVNLRAFLLPAGGITCSTAAVGRHGRAAWREVEHAGEGEEEDGGSERGGRAQTRV